MASRLTTQLDTRPPVAPDAADSADPAIGGAPPTGRRRSLPRWRSRRWAALAGALVVVLVAVAAWVATQQRWSTVWSDDFDGRAGALPDRATWRVDTGTSYPGGAANWGTGEVETYTADPRNVSTDGAGHLAITPLRDASGAWTSGRVETERTDFRPGEGQAMRVEARIRTPDGGQGYWPAFWMLPAPFRQDPTFWPRGGEIDILENIGREKATVHGTLHCGTAPGGPCAETNGISGARTQPDGTALSSSFHTYAVEWDRSTSPEQLRWYLDGEPYFTVRSTDVDRATWEQATGHGFFVLLNVAVGGGWPGLPDATTRPGRPMLVDWVRVQER